MHRVLLAAAVLIAQVVPAPALAPMRGHRAPPTLPMEGNSWQAPLPAA